MWHCVLLVSGVQLSWSLLVPLLAKMATMPSHQVCGEMAVGHADLCLLAIGCGLVPSPAIQVIIQQ